MKVLVKKKGDLFGDIILFILLEDAHQIKIVRRDLFCVSPKL